MEEEVVEIEVVVEVVVVVVVVVVDEDAEVGSWSFKVGVDGRGRGGFRGRVGEEAEAKWEISLWKRPLKLNWDSLNIKIYYVLLEKKTCDFGRELTGDKTVLRIPFDLIHPLSRTEHFW